MKADKIALGILGGIAVGAALGLLFAPEKGEETRKKIAKKSNNYADQLKDKFGNILGNLNNSYEKIQKEGEDFIAKGKTNFEQGKKEFKNINA